MGVLVHLLLLGGSVRAPFGCACGRCHGGVLAPLPKKTRGTGLRRSSWTQPTPLWRSFVRRGIVSAAPTFSTLHLRTGLFSLKRLFRRFCMILPDVLLLPPSVF